MGGSGVRRGNATTSRTKGMGGHGVTRGIGRIRGGDAGRWAAVTQGEAIQQPAGLDA
jgi:hypothetical protein